MTLPVAPSMSLLLAELKRRLGDFSVDGWEGRSGDELYQAVARVFSHLAQRVRFYLLSGYTRRARGAARGRTSLLLSWSATTTHGWTLVRDQVLFETPWGARFRLLEDLTREASAPAGSMTIEVEAEWAGFDYFVAPGTVTRFVVPQTIDPAASLVFSEETSADGKTEFINSVGAAGGRDAPEAWLTVTNLSSGELGELGLPETAATGLLDLLAMERGLPREAGEGDETLRVRIRSLPDILTPAAVLRSVRAAYAAGFAERFGEGAEPANVAFYEYWNYGEACGVGACGVHPAARAWSFEVTIPELPYLGIGEAPGVGACGVHPCGSTGEPEREGLLAALQGLINRIKAPGIWGALYES